MKTNNTKSNLEFRILKPGCSKASIFGLILFLFPGTLILTINLFSELGLGNPFTMLLLFLAGGILAFAGLIIYLFAKENVKKKIISILVGLSFYALLLPIIWGVNGMKERIYINKHQVFLKNVADDLLKDKITIEDANKILEFEESILKVICVPDENKHVLFLLDGFLDNCSGFSYSLTDIKPSKNCCGDLIKWKKMKQNWYKWGTN